MPTLHWVGKEKIVGHHHDVPFKILNKEYTHTSQSSNSTNNRIIHGDNLEVLKALLPEFEGKVNCVYIDPPYNTGNEEWAYNDNVKDPRIQRWLERLVGKDGEDLTRHDKWLCMMYPRLKLLHRLLANDGVIFISLDENEFCRMRLVMEEIFGESNFLAQIIVQSNKRGQTYKQIAKTHEYLICFGKSSESSLGELETGGDNLPQEDGFGKYSSRELRNRNPKFGKFNRPNLFYPIYADLNNPDHDGFFPVSITASANCVSIEPFNSEGTESCWRWGKDKVLKDNSSKNCKVLYAKQTRDGGWRVFEKYRKESIKAKSIWLDTKYISEQGTTELTRLGLGGQFQFPKPVALVEDCIALATNEDAIILDSFAGSGTTAHAVLKLNDKDGGNRRFILTEMLDYAEDVTAERVRRVMDGYGEGEKFEDGLGGSFEYYTIGEALFNEDGNLNECVPVDDIRRYVAYAEGIGYSTSDVSPYCIGKSSDAIYIFNYEPGRSTTLDFEFLSTLQFTNKSRPATIVVYADNCLLSQDQLQKHGIIFKKIPRDITLF